MGNTNGFGPISASTGTKNRWFSNGHTGLTPHPSVTSMGNNNGFGPISANSVPPMNKKHSRKNNKNYKSRSKKYKKNN